MRTYQERRHFDNRAIERKKKILDNLYVIHVPAVPLGKLNKGKVHCSCGICSQKSSKIQTKTNSISCNSKALLSYRDLKNLERTNEEMSDSDTNANQYYDNIPVIPMLLLREAYIDDYGSNYHVIAKTFLENLRELYSSTMEKEGKARNFLFLLNFPYLYQENGYKKNVEIHYLTKEERAIYTEMSIAFLETKKDFLYLKNVDDTLIATLIDFSSHLSDFLKKNHITYGTYILLK